MIKDIKWPKECLLLVIRRGEKEILPHGETVLKAGDTLVLLTTPKDRGFCLLNNSVAPPDKAEDALSVLAGCIKTAIMIIKPPA